MVALGDPRRDDPDHAGMPALGREDERVALGMVGDQRLGLEPDPRLDVAPLGVHRVQLRGDRAGALAVLGQQQLEPGVGAVQAPGGVQPRPEPEADRRLVDRARVHARDVHQRPQPDLARAGQRAQPGADQPPVLAEQRDDVGDRGQRDQVEVLVGECRVLPRRGEQRARELERHAGGAQVGARVAVQPRVHERRVRQRAVGARAVMVGDDDVEPERPRRRDLLDRGHRAVDGDQQSRPARGQPLDGRAREPVAVVDPARAGTSRRPRRACAARARGSRSSRCRPRRSRRAR